MQPPPSALFHLDPRWTRSMVLRIVPLALLLGVVLTMLGSVSATWFGDTVGTVVGLVIGIAAAAGVVLAFHVRGRALTQVCVLRLSPWGIELWGADGVQQQMAWSQVEGRNDVTVRSPTAGGVSLTPQSFATSSMGNGLRPRERVSGVIGWSQMLHGEPRGPRVRLPHFVPDPMTGLVHVTVPFSEYDPAWPQGPIGAWVRAYRPDVMADAGVFTGP